MNAIKINNPPKSLHVYCPFFSLDNIMFVFRDFLSEIYAYCIAYYYMSCVVLLL